MREVMRMRLWKNDLFFCRNDFFSGVNVSANPLDGFFSPLETFCAPLEGFFSSLEGSANPLERFAYLLKDSAAGLQSLFPVNVCSVQKTGLVH